LKHSPPRGSLSKAIEQVAEEFVSTWTGHDDDRGEVAGVLRASLNDQPVRYRGYDPDRLLVIWVGVSYRLIKESQLQTDAIRDLVLNAERVARERGVRLAPANRLGSLGSDSR
jgi:hypothetical protein